MGVRSSLVVGVLAGLSLIAAPVCAEPMRIESASGERAATAKKKFEQGKKLYAAGKLEEAIAAFRASHDAVQDPRTSLMIARARRNGGELVEAHDAYRAALSEAEEAARRDPTLDATVEEAKKELKDLDGMFGSLTIELIHAPAGTTVTLDGRTLGAEELKQPIRVAPGPLTVEAVAPDGTAVTRARRASSVLTAPAPASATPIAWHRARAEPVDRRAAARAMAARRETPRAAPRAPWVSASATRRPAHRASAVSPTAAAARSRS